MLNKLKTIHLCRQYDLVLKIFLDWASWCTPMLSRELRQEAQDVKVSLDDIESSRPAYVMERPCPKKTKGETKPFDMLNTFTNVVEHNVSVH